MVARKGVARCLGLATGALTVLSITMAGSAFATGPSGSKEHPRSHQVRCGAGTDTPVGVIYASPANGVEVCSDEDGSPIDGRIILDTGEGYASIDGDPSNSSFFAVPGRPRFADGFARVDSGGAHCDEDHRYWDSTTQEGECRP